MTQIFRKEALAHQRNRLDGEIAVGTALPTSLLAYGLAAVVFTMIVFSFLANYSHQETISGWLVGDGRIIHVSAPRGGQIENISVKEGQIVDQGAPLVLVRSLVDSSPDGKKVDLGAGLYPRKLASPRSYTITAPVKGRIAVVPFEIGNVMPPGSTVAVVSQSNILINAELFAPSRMFGMIKPGQTVTVRYQAFPSQIFGYARGVVTYVSETVIDSNELNAPANVAKEPVFRVKVALQPDKSHSATPLPIQPGMLLNADIDVDRRPLIAWLLNTQTLLGRPHGNS